MQMSTIVLKAKCETETQKFRESKIDSMLCIPSGQCDFINLLRTVFIPLYFNGCQFITHSGMCLSYKATVIS